MRDQAELMGQIERGQRFIGEDPARFSGQHTGQQDPCAFAA